MFPNPNQNVDLCDVSRKFQVDSGGGDDDDADGVFNGKNQEYGSPQTVDTFPF